MRFSGLHCWNQGRNLDLKGEKLACWRHVVVLAVGDFVESVVAAVVGVVDVVDVAVAAVVAFVAGVFDLDLVEE
jgi:hypothetical protein